MEPKLEDIVTPLLEWYQKYKRALPWREDKNPYHVWLSEIMLQQTRIEAVKEYYTRFLKELPTLQDLAKVKEEKLLKLWEGLGYYNRARNLKKAAEMMVQEYQGKMPNTYEKIMTLPGIGEYTAGAISSICFHEKVLAVDGNVMRVISRILASKKNILLPTTKQEIEQKLKNIIPEEAGDFNEALMELGETICLPNGVPLCEKCPLKAYCKANHQHLTEEIPVRKKKIKRKKENRTVLLLEKEHEIAVSKRKKTGLLAGMYEFPNKEGKLTKKQIEELLKSWNLEIESLKKIGEAVHLFSHLEWHMVAYQIKVKQKNTTFHWITKKQLKEDFALPSAFAKWKQLYLQEN